MELQGEIVGYSEAGNGSIKGNDGEFYHFRSDDCIGITQIKQGQWVRFEVNGNKAVLIYLLNSHDLDVADNNFNKKKLKKTFLYITIGIQILYLILGFSLRIIGGRGIYTLFTAYYIGITSNGLYSYLGWWYFPSTSYIVSLSITLAFISGVSTLIWLIFGQSLAKRFALDYRKLLRITTSLTLTLQIISLMFLLSTVVSQRLTIAYLDSIFIMFLLPILVTIFSFLV